MNTEISYMYRDASNYKQINTVIFVGRITKKEKALILAARDEDQYFIPGQVGLEELQPRMIAFPDEQDDHVWHELNEDDITLTENPASTKVSIHDFAKKFQDITWDVEAACTRLGIVRTQL